MLAFIEKCSLTCSDAIRLTEREGLKGVKSTTKLLKKCWKKINSNKKKLTYTTHLPFICPQL